MGTNEDNFTIDEEAIRRRVEKRVADARIVIEAEETRLERRKGLLLEAISVLHHQYGIDYLYHFRSRVNSVETIQEILTAENALLTIGNLKSEME